VSLISHTHAASGEEAMVVAFEDATVADVAMVGAWWAKRLNFTPRRGAERMPRATAGRGATTAEITRLPRPVRVDNLSLGGGVRGVAILFGVVTSRGRFVRSGCDVHGPVRPTLERIIHVETSNARGRK